MNTVRTAAAPASERANPLARCHNSTTVIAGDMDSRNASSRIPLAGMLAARPKIRGVNGPPGRLPEFVVAVKDVKMRGYVFKVVDTSSGRVIADRVRLARTLGERLIGLIGARRLDSGAGLWLRPCNGIHTFGIRFPLDILVLDRQDRVIYAASRVSSNRVLPPQRGGFSTLELQSGSACEVRPGAQLAFVPVEAEP